MNRRSFQQLRHQSGQAITLVVVAIALTGAISIMIAQMLSSMYRESRAMSEKLSTLAFTNSLIQYVGNSTSCNLMISGMQAKSFDVARVGTSTPPMLEIAKLPWPTQPNTETFATVGQPLSPTSSSAITKAIQLKVLSGSNDLYTADLELSLDETKLVRPLRPIVMKVALTTDPASPPTAKVINGCSTNAVASEQWELIWSGSVGGSNARVYGTESLMAGKKFSDYKSVFFVGFGPNPSVIGQFGKAHSTLPVSILKAKANILFETQSFSGNDSGTTGIQYVDDTSFRWGTYRLGSLNEVWGLK